MSAFDTLLSGNMFQGFLQTYAGAGVESGMLYMIILMLAYGLIYMKFKNLMLLSLVTFLTSIIVMPFVQADMQKWFFAMALGGLALGLYKVFKGTVWT